MRVSCPLPFNPPFLDLNNIWRRLQVMKFLMWFSRDFLYFLLLEI
jgi:hypothetical protein